MQHRGYREEWKVNSYKKVQLFEAEMRGASSFTFITIFYLWFSSALESDYKWISRTSASCSSFLCIPWMHSWHMLANITLCYTSVELLSFFLSALFAVEKLTAIAFLQVLISLFLRLIASL